MENKQTGSLEFEETFSKMKLDIRFTRTMISTFLILAIIAKVFLKIPISPVVIFLMLIWFCCYFIYQGLIEKSKTSHGLYNIYFRYNINDLLFLTFIIHFLGGAEWLGAIFYILVLVTAGVILPKARAIKLGIIAWFFYTCLILFEYLGIIRHRPLFSLEPGLYQSLSYLGIQILIFIAFFYFVAETAGTFSDTLKARTGQLEKAFQAEEEAKEVLEIRVRARTRELEQLSQSLEEKVDKRTKELQEKIKELEKFQKLVVGRELKMIELKKKLGKKVPKTKLKL